MATYLVALFVPETTMAGRGVWWLHTVALLVFLPLIPHTKHLHLVLSPATILLKRERFSDIPKLQGDEDFGLVTGKDLTRTDALQALSCVECGRCTEHCPAYNTGKILSPKELNPWCPQLPERGRARFRQTSARRIYLRRGRLPMHHMWQLRVSMPRRDSAPADDHRVTPRSRKHWRVGRLLRHQAVPQDGEERQLPRDGCRRAHEVSSKKAACRSMMARRNTACGWVVWVLMIRRDARRFSLS